MVTINYHTKKLRKMKPVSCCLGLLLYASFAWAQSPEVEGMRFNRFAMKDSSALAPKAGGPTERIEIQSTDDHIDYVIKTYVLQHANASEVYQLVLNAVSLEGGSVDRIAPGSVVRCEGSNAKVGVDYSGDSMLVVTAPEWMIPYLDETIGTLDRADLEAAAFGTGCLFTRPRHRRPSELARLIAESVASGVEVFVPDDSRNILYLEDTPSYFGGVVEALNRFDAPPRQIDARVRIYEIDENKAKDVGLDWNTWKKSVSDGSLTINWDNAGGPGSYNVDLQSLSAELSFNPLLATEFLNYIVSQGTARVLSDTRLTLTNGQPGYVRAVSTIPYVIGGFMDNDVADSPVRDSPEALDVDRRIREFSEGVTIEIIPTIGAETIELEVLASVGSHVGYTPNQGVPIVAESEIKSVVELQSGVPVVLGGLTRESRVTEEAGIPGLRSIWGLKYLFAHEVQRKHTSQVIITVLPNRAEAGEYPQVATEVLPGE